jgi:hypothetical protein
VKPTISSKFVRPLRKVYVTILFLCIIIEIEMEILHLGFTRSRKW